MKKQWKTGLAGALAACLLLAGVPCRAAENAAPEGPETAPTAWDGYLVALRQDQPVLLSQQTRAALEPVCDGVYRTDDPELLLRLQDQGLVDYVERDYLIPLWDSQETEPGPRLQAETQSVPAWNWHQLGLRTAADLGLDGSGVRVAFIDSGLEPENPNLAGASIARGWDYVTDSDRMTDGVGHGTKVAQTMVGRGVDGAVLGVAPGAELVPLRCFDSGGYSRTSDLCAAIDAAVHVFHCDVINMSWGMVQPEPAGAPGSPGYEDQLKLVQDFYTLRGAIENAAEQGVLLVAAAGNGYDPSRPSATYLEHYPACFDQVIGVGSVDRYGQVSSFSQRTFGVDVSAPGQELPFLCARSHRLCTDSGTSFAAPTVAGVLALMRQLAPQLTVGGARAALTERSEDRGEAGWDSSYGCGFVRADLLFGSTWYRAGADLGEGWYREQGDGTLFTAVYDRESRMERCTAVPLTGGLAPISVPLTDRSGGVKLFCLDGSGAPLNAALQLPAAG